MPVAVAVIVVLFARGAAADSFSTLHEFAGGGDTSFPNHAMIASGSTFFGTTLGGFDGGAVYKLDADGSNYEVLNRLGPTRPTALVRIGDSLFGTTARGGVSDGGTLYRLGIDGTGFDVLHMFTGGADDGTSPSGDLAVVGETIYGTTFFGGTENRGTLFKINANGAGFELLRRFGDAAFNDGRNPDGGVMVDGDVMYLTTRSFGRRSLDSESGAGAIVKILTDGTGYQLLHDFAPSGDEGSLPGALVVHGTTLFGTTENGGRGREGTIFRINTDGTGFRTLYEFSGDEGGGPVGRLLLDGDVIYGTTSGEGPMGGGSVFKLNSDGTGFRVLHEFTSPDENGTKAGLVKIGSRLFGVHPDSPNGFGSVFAVTIEEPFAATYFDEPAIGQSRYVPGEGRREFGFETTKSPTSALAGVALLDEKRVLSHRAVRATTSFDAVELGGYTNVEVSIAIHILNTNYEDGDFLRVYVTNGIETVDLFYEAGTSGTDRLENIAATLATPGSNPFLTISGTLPSTWTLAQIVIDSSTDSSSERFDFDNVFFRGTPVPEPPSMIIAALGLLLTARTKSWLRWQRFGRSQRT